MEYASKTSLDAGFQEILDSNSSTGLTLWTSVTRSLNQFHLTGLYTEAYVINEVYLRAAKFIDHDGTIDNLMAWSRATAYNYIRELSRRHNREQLYPSDAAIFDQNHVSSGLISDTDIDEEYEIINRAFDQLSAADQQLIGLHVINNLSWREIHDRLRAQGQPDRTEAALRKAKERAIRRLRDNYHEIKLPQI